MPLKSMLMGGASSAGTPFSTAAMWGITPSTRRLVAFFKMFGPIIIKAVERIAAKNTVSSFAQWGFK